MTAVCLPQVTKMKPDGRVKPAKLHHDRTKDRIPAELGPKGMRVAMYLK